MEKNEIFEKKITVDVVVAGLKNPMRYVLNASEKELQQLAQRFDVEKIYSLQADLLVYPGEIVKIKGEISALTKRECVVSLEKFDEKMSEDFEVLYSFDPSVNPDEIIDPIVNGRIHLGDVVAEQYGLALNPFPKKTTVSEFYNRENEERQYPFANLKSLLKKK